MRQVFRYAVLLLALSFANAPAAGATTVIAKTLADLCAEADMVFVGTVATVASRWTDATQQSIETSVTFSVAEPLFGTDQSNVTLTFGGGEVGDVREEVAGLPHFTPGDRVIIFARRQRSVSPIVGFNQGYVRIVDGPSGQVVLSADGRPITRLSDDGLLTGQSDADIGAAISASTFLDVVRARVAPRSGGQR